MFSLASRVGIRLYAWKMKPIFSRRTRVRSFSERALISLSSRNTWPDVMRSRPARQWRSVDLPEPEGPMMTMKWPAGTSIDRPSRARTAVSPRPYTLVTSTARDAIRVSAGEDLGARLVALRAGERAMSVLLGVRCGALTRRLRPNASPLELVGDAGELLGDFPQATGVVDVVRLLGRLHPLGCAALFEEAARAEELAALHVGSGGPIELGQGAVSGRLGHEVGPCERRPRLEIGVGVPGVSDGCDDVGPRGAGSAVELEREQQVGQLRPAVRQPLAIRPLPLQVVEVHLADLVTEAGDVDDTPASLGLELREEEPGEREVAEVVGAELHLEPVRRLATLIQRHDAGVVHEDVEILTLARVPLCELPHRRQIGEV